MCARGGTRRKGRESSRERGNDRVGRTTRESRQHEEEEEDEEKGATQGRGEEESTYGGGRVGSARVRQRVLGNVTRCRIERER